jgi:hypothetical protein
MEEKVAKGSAKIKKQADKMAEKKKKAGGVFKPKVMKKKAEFKNK